MWCFVGFLGVFFGFFSFSLSCMIQQTVIVLWHIKLIYYNIESEKIVHITKRRQLRMLQWKLTLVNMIVLKQYQNLQLLQNLNQYNYVHVLKSLVKKLWYHPLQYVIFQLYLCIVLWCVVCLQTLLWQQVTYSYWWDDGLRFALEEAAQLYFIVLAHWNNCPQVNLAELHSDTLSWFVAN